MTPAEQIAKVLAGLKPGETPEIPDFLRVDQAEQERRNTTRKPKAKK